MAVSKVQRWDRYCGTFKQNDLAYEIDQNLSMYADDHQLYEVNENVPTVNHNLNANATKASVWYKSNLLKGNLSKYHNTMPITNKQVGNEFGVRVQGIVLSY